MSKKQAISIGAKLYPGEDDDLIRFFNQVPAGKRSTVMKAMLRSVAANGHEPYLEDDEDNAENVSREVQRLRHDLDHWVQNDLPTLVSNLFADMATATVDEDAVRRIVQEIVRQSPQGDTGKVSEAGEDAEGPQLGRKEQLRRSSKIKARGW